MSVAETLPETKDALGDLSVQQRMELQFEIEQFLYEEAAMIDGREYRAWLDLWTDDCSYWMPIRQDIALHARDEDGVGVFLVGRSPLAYAPFRQQCAHCRHGRG